MLTVLTSEYGKVTVLAKGARKVGSKFFSCSANFVYGVFTVGKTRDMLYLRESDIIRTFYKLSQNDLSGYALMSYVCQVAEDVATSGEEQALLSLVLNTLHLIQLKEKSAEHIKAVFEMRCAVVCGFLPDVEACRVCGELKNEMFLEIMNGTVVCRECKSVAPRVDLEYESEQRTVIAPLTPSSLNAIQHIVYSHPKKIFSFNIVGNDAELLYSACEKYLLNHLERTFPALEYYHSVTDVTH